MAIKDKITQIMPWNWGKKLVPVRSRQEHGLVALQRDFGRLFDRMLDEVMLPALRGDWFAPLTGPTELLGTDWPCVDVEETDDEVRVTAEIPGMDEKDIDVTVGDRSVTIRGNKTGRREESNKDYHLMETYYGAFHRTVPLPVEVDADGATATYRKGELTVTLPKIRAGQRAARKIKVN